MFTSLSSEQDKKLTAVVASKWKLFKVEAPSSFYILGFLRTRQEQQNSGCV